MCFLLVLVFFLTFFSFHRCLHPDIIEISECIAAKAQIINKTFTREDCEAHGFGCLSKLSQERGTMIVSTKEECDSEKGLDIFFFFF